VAAPPIWSNAREKRVLVSAAVLSMVAAIVHAALTPGHFEEWVGYGLFFFFATFAQLFYGILLLLQPWRYHPELGPRPGAAKTTRLFYAVGIWGNVALVLMYLVSRTIGIPFFGPEAGEVEAWSIVGVATKLIELALIGCLQWLMRQVPTPEIVTA
jgi:hypothetical protein